MAKLPTFKRLFKGDFKSDYSDLIDKLSITVNGGIDTLYDALNNKITLRNNILCDVKDFTVQVNSLGIPTTTLDLNVSFRNNVNIITIGRIVNLTNPNIFPSSGVTLTWEQQSNGLVRIKHITGLTEGFSYSLRVVIYGDES